MRFGEIGRAAAETTRIPKSYLLIPSAIRGLVAAIRRFKTGGTEDRRTQRPRGRKNYLLIRDAATSISKQLQQFSLRVSVFSGPL